MKLLAGLNGDFFLTSDLIERVLKNSATSIRIPDIVILDDGVDGEGVETFTLELVDPKFFVKSSAALNISIPTPPEYTDIIDTIIFIHRNFSQLIVYIEDDDGKPDVQPFLYTKKYTELSVTNFSHSDFSQV